MRNKYPKHYIISAREISLDLHIEIIKYFKILAAYITGITDHLNIDEYDVIENKQLKYIFDATPKCLLSGDDSTGIISALIEEAKQFTKPIVFGV